jgi:single-strand DNA-binding protein
MEGRLMSGSVNKCILIGNLCADPETRSFQNGGKVANLRLATNETWKDRDSGERKERTEYHTVAVFGDGLAGVAARYLRKGSKVYVEGQLRTRKWQDKDGADRYSTEVVLQGPGAVLTMLDPPGERKRGYDEAPENKSAGGWVQSETNRADLDDDSDIPF